MCQSFPVKKIRGEDEKIAVKPGNLQTSCIAAFSLLLPLITSITASASWAQGSVVPNRITSIQEGRDKTYIELTTEKSSVPNRPIIKILPQDNGDTVMVADFVGLSWQHPTRVFSTGTRFGAHEKGIKVIRAGSFQERPPICRISITSNDKNLLSRVSFGAGPGKLTVTWPGRAAGSAPELSAGLAPRIALPRFAPPQRNEEKQIAQRGDSIRRVEFDGSRSVRQRLYEPVQNTQVSSADAELAARAAEFAARRDLELATPGNAAPLSINTSQDEQPPVAPSHRLTLRPEIANDGFGVGEGLTGAGQSFASQAPEPKSAPGRNSEIPLKAVAMNLDSTIPLPTRQPEPKPSAPKQPAFAKPIVRLSDKPAGTSAKPLEGQTGLANTAPDTKGRQLTKPPLKAASNNAPPPLAPNRVGSGDVKPKATAKASPESRAKGDEESSKEPKRKGLLSSLFKKVKETLTTEPADDIEGQDGEQGTPDSQLDDLQADKIAPKGPVAPAAPAVRPSVIADQADAVKNAEREEAPLVEVLQTGTGTTVRVTAAGPSDLNFHSFKLQDPPRFVVDFDNLRSLSAAAIQQPEKTNKLLGIRVGAPDATTTTGRLVLDLASPEITVIPSDPGKPNVVAFTIGTSRDSLSGLMPKSGSTVVLDAGHGGTDCGAQRGSVQEKELTLSIAKATQKVLQSRGVKVIMTRDSDDFISLQDRVNITNSVKPDLFLSVHINAMESTNTIYGVETYYQNAASQALAGSIHESLVSDLEVPDRRIRKARFVVINRTEVPAVLAEVGFISNKAERDKLVSADYQEKIAKALAKGAILFLNQQAGATKHLADRAPSSSETSARSSTTARERKIEAASDSADKEKRVDTGVPSVSRVAQKGLSIQQK